MKMTEIINKLQGIITVLNTPFTESNKIDEKSLRENIDLALQAGVAGFLVPGKAGEVDKLTERERIFLVSVVVDEVKGRSPVIGCASAEEEQKRNKIGRKLIDLGCDGILADITYNSEQEYCKQVQSLADLKPDFLILQDWDFSGYGVPVPVIVRLFAEVDVFKGIKIEVVPAGIKYSELLEATSGQLHVSGGWAVMQFIEAMNRGVHAFMPTGMHRIYTEIYSLYQHNKKEAARDLFHEVLPVLAFSNQHLDISIHFFKRLLFRQGIYATSRVRKPILKFDKYHEKIAEDLIQLVMEITESLEK